MQRIVMAPVAMSITEIYKKVALVLGYKDEDVEQYDCTKITVSEDLADAVEQWYKMTYERDLGDDWKQKFGMEWVCFGPKTDEDLPNGIVEVEDGFIELKEAI